MSFWVWLTAIGLLLFAIGVIFLSELESARKRIAELERELDRARWAVERREEPIKELQDEVEEATQRNT